MNEITISELASHANPAQFAGLPIANSRQNPYRCIPAASDSALDPVWYAEIVDYASAGRVVVAQDGGDVVGVAVYVDLPWDSRILNRRMGVLKYVFVHPAYPRRQVIGLLLDRLIAWVMDRQIECLLGRAYADDVATIHALEERGFLLMDTLLDYVYDSERDPLNDVPRPALSDPFSIRPALAEDAEALKVLAQVVFDDHFGRFHSDERIPRSLATQIYQAWMTSSLAGYADVVLVAEAGGRIAGCSIWKEPSPLEQRLGLRLGHYSIGLVHPDFHRRGLFSALTYAGMAELDGRAALIEGPTHVNNYGVQRGYTKLHWQIRDARHSFHKWLRG
ncbi:MAG: GNAT family N-acetyltransferase [Anaerolineae bacterium]|nr:GNAT family N-acetyltransferase [Anaerolineae bacterium]